MTILWGPRVPRFFVVPVEFGLQVELLGRHIIQAVGISPAIGVAFGAGAGYAYEWQLVPKILRVEIGGVVGFFVADDGTESSPEGYWLFVMLRPTLHVGYKFFFFSVGPRMLIGDSVIGGFTAGFLFRI